MQQHLVKEVLCFFNGVLDPTETLPSKEMRQDSLEFNVSPTLHKHVVSGKGGLMYYSSATKPSPRIHD